MKGDQHRPPPYGWSPRTHLCSNRAQGLSQALLFKLVEAQDGEQSALHQAMLGIGHRVLPAAWKAAVFVILNTMAREPRECLGYRDPEHIGDIIEAMLGFCVPLNQARITLRNLFGKNMQLPAFRLPCAARPTEDAHATCLEVPHSGPSS